MSERYVDEEHTITTKKYTTLGSSDYYTEKKDRGVIAPPEIQIKYPGFNLPVFNFNQIDDKEAHNKIKQSLQSMERAYVVDSPRK